MSEGLPQNFRVLGIVPDYATLHAMLRSRCEELNISRETLDDVSGLQSGYTSKMLAPIPTESRRRAARRAGKRLTFRTAGVGSLGPLLTSLACTLVLVEDVATLEKLKPRLTERERPTRAADAPQRRRGFDSAFARILRARQLLDHPPAKRSMIARKAAKARWAGHRRTNP